jgi:hypothetical protein
VRLRVGRRQVSVHSTALVSGGLLVGMGLFTLVIAAQGKSMRSSGWQASLSAQLQHYAHVATIWAGDAPGWVSAAVVAAALLGLGWIALNQATAPPQPPDHPPEDPNEQDEHPPSDWQSAQSGTAG